jgi:rRNA-processing protein FCF1
MMTESRRQKRALKIILDSNALFVPIQFKIDIFEELGKLLGGRFEPVLLSSIRDEIEAIAETRSPKIRRNASYAMELIKKCRLVKIDEGALSPDDAIVKTAQERNWPVFTNDRRLRKRLRDINVPVVYVRQKSRLEIDGRP